MIKTSATGYVDDGRVINLLLAVCIVGLSLLFGSRDAHAQDICFIETAPNSNLKTAIALFEKDCAAYARRDCDPVADGAWQCSSGVIGNNAPSGGGQPSNPPSQPPTEPPPVEPPSGEPGTPPQTDACTATGSSLNAAKNAYANSCPNEPRADCDPIGGGNWECSSQQIGGSAPSQTPTTPTTPTPTPPTPTPPTPTPPTPTPPTPTPPTPTPPPPTPVSSTGKIDNGDLLALHYDNCPDRDDGHAMAAGYTIAQTLNISPLVVNGTCGNLIRDKYQSSSSNVVNATFSTALNAETARNQSVSQATTQWASVLANGDDVWVAEGGPSDFTAEVLRQIDMQFPGLDRKRVHVVQHSNWNEEMTTSANLQFVKSVTSYVRIQDGNGTNETADFNQLSDLFVSQARSSRFANGWNAAFDYLDPNRRLDFSDTVELLYIINDTATKTPDDFANRYLD